MFWVQRTLRSGFLIPLGRKRALRDFGSSSSFPSLLPSFLYYFILSSLPPFLLTFLLSLFYYFLPSSVPLSPPLRSPPFLLPLFLLFLLFAVSSVDDQTQGSQCYSDALSLICASVLYWKILTVYLMRLTLEQGREWLIRCQAIEAGKPLRRWLL